MSADRSDLMAAQPRPRHQFHSRPDQRSNSTRRQDAHHDDHQPDLLRRGVVSRFMGEIESGCTSQQNHGKRQTEQEECPASCRLPVRREIRSTK